LRTVEDFLGSTSSDLASSASASRRFIRTPHRREQGASEILDDFAYVTKDHAETSVLFELIAARYD
jgi:hypothetical protein